MHNENTAREEQGGIQDIPMLDLTWAKSPEDLSGIKKIKDVAIVLVPASLAEAVYKIPMEDVADVAILPEGVKPSLMTGQVKMTGESLAGGSSETILIVIGQFFITTPVSDVGYKEVWVTGQMFAPRGSEEAISKKLAKVTGQTFYYPQSARVVLMGGETWNRAFLEVLPEETSYCFIMSGLRIDDDVTAELLKSRISEIALLMSNIKAPKDLLPVLQLLAREKTMSNINEKKPTDSEGDSRSSGKRIVESSEVWNQAFIELLPEQITYVIEGTVTVEDDIDPQLLRSKISKITLEGTIEAPKRLIPMIQLLTVHNEGNIVERG